MRKATQVWVGKAEDDFRAASFLATLFEDS